MGDYRAELQALIAAYDEHGGRWPEADVDALCQAVQRARAALDGPAVPEGREPAAIEGQPSDEKLLCIAAEAIGGYGDAGIEPGEYESFTESVVEAYGSELCAFARAVLARWGGQQPRPIPVSERLPGPEDCQPWPGEPDETHWCWVLVKGSLGVDSWERRPATCLAGYRPMHTHWLPANALPLPEAQP